jgi:hypothetical protein
MHVGPRLGARSGVATSSPSRNHMVLRTSFGHSGASPYQIDYFDLTNEVFYRGIDKH